MSHALEQELRAVLAERAQALPAVDPQIWLERIDAGEAGRAPARRRRATWGAGIAALAATLAAFLVLSSGSVTRRNQPAGQISLPAAFVGWTPAPSKATARRIAIYAKRCEWAASYKSQLGSPLIADVRGPYTAIMFVVKARNYERHCIYGPNAGGQGSGQLVALPLQGPPGPHGIQHASAGGSCNPATGGAVTQMLGEVGRRVTAATFLFARHPRVVATVKDGFYFVWWPWSDLPVRARLLTLDGPRSIKLFGGPVFGRGLRRGC